MRRRRAELGLSVRSVANQLGVSGIVVTGLETGSNHQDLPLGLVARLAAILGLDTADLFRRDEEAASGDALESDVAAVGGLLFEAGIVTPTSALRRALGWNPRRLRIALDQLDGRLRAVGMRLSRQDDRSRIVRDVTATSPSEVAALIRSHITRDGLNRAEASILFRIEEGRAPREPSNPEAVAIGTLLNAGLIEVGKAPTGTSERPLVLSDVVRFSLMLDGMAQESGSCCLQAH